jgi:hypothetical protein
MPSEIEKYLRDNRQGLDVESPDDLLIWEGIRNELHHPPAKISRKRLWLKIRNTAAVVVIVISVGYVLTDLITNRSNSNRITLAIINEELGNQEAELQKLVEYKMDEISSMSLIDNLIIAELFDEIRVLDTIYEKSIEDLEEMGYNERVIQTIFDTYEKKIYLLELIILENQKIKDHETDHNIWL